jgi:hypothetical protein
MKKSAHIDLERHILHGIACEWETAWHGLDPDIRYLIRRPTFVIKDLRSQWGHWSPEKRQISVSRRLVHDYPWDSIRDVLLHEMAHQVACALPHASRHTPHGPPFQQACKMLRIDSAASGNYRTLQDRLHEENHAGMQDKRLLRVKKLLALAESKNRFEAEAAMAKAHELIARYNIELTRQQENLHLLSIFIGSPALRHPREDYCLANLLQDFYFVYGIWVPAYVLGKHKMGRVLEISGTAHNLKMADYVHYFIRTFIESRWLVYNHEKKLNRYRKTDFAVGILEGFRDKLETSITRKKGSQGTRAVIAREDPRLIDYCRYRYPHTNAIRRGASKRDIRVIKDGRKVGQNLVIARGVCERKTGGPRLITGT